jgi:hypothetical protein
MLSLDLHVLSTPPAFVLSQDQTLQQKSGKSTLANKFAKGTSNEDKNWHWLIKHPVEFSRNKHPPTPTLHQGQSSGQLL